LEKDNVYYDEGYIISKNTLDNYACEPNHSKYFESWNKVISWIGKKESILDLGCGSGQFAQLAIKNRMKYALGIDFSKVAIDWAKERNRKNEDCFLCEKIESFKDYDNFDVIVILETLEHVNDDIEIIMSIPRGKHVILSVPSFSLQCHVRHFKTQESAIDRYSKYIDVIDMDAININPTGVKHRYLWLFNGFLL
jgi:2-polyprenyl-3-methyl-5-hydroxy-6-metoxy-1,4-benzoquinol methylase